MSSLEGFVLRCALMFLVGLAIMVWLAMYAERRRHRDGRYKPTVVFGLALMFVSVYYNVTAAVSFGGGLFMLCAVFFHIRSVEGIVPVALFLACLCAGALFGKLVLNRIIQLCRHTLGPA